MSPGTIPRRHDLDALRAFAMLLGIALHAAIAYVPMPEGAWPVQDVRQGRGFGLFLSAVHGFRMPLFFLVSGFFTAMLWRKRGLAALLRQRFRRIFLPLVIGVFTVVPAVWVVSIGAGIAGPRASGGVADANIWTAALAGDVGALEGHLADGADPDEREPESGATPMSMAALHGHADAIELLIAHGADVNARNRDGATPLHAAAFLGRSNAARVLLEHGADPDAMNRNGERIADTLEVNWGTTQVIAGILGVEVERPDVSSGREEISRLLQRAGPSSRPPAETAATLGGGAPEPTADPMGGLVRGLGLLLIYFPFFHHLWFLWFLCWLVAAFVAYAKLAELLRWSVPAWLVLSPLRYAWLIPLTIVPQSMMGLLYPTFGPDTSAGLLPMPHVLLYYAIFFFFGALYFDADDATGRIGRWWRVSLPIALLVVFPVGYQLTLGGLGFGDGWLDSRWSRPIAVALQASYAWLVTFGLIGLFRDLLARENKAIRYLSDSAYWLYLAHLPLIIVAQAVVRDWPIPALAKFALVCATTSAILLASYQLFVRYTPIGTLLNGPRVRPDRVTDSVPIGSAET